MSRRSVRIYGESSIQSLADEASPLVDPLVKALYVIDSVHGSIHRGIVYQSTYVDSAVIDTGTLRMLMRVPAGSTPHAAFTVSAGGQCLVAITEGVTVTGAGTAVTAVNRNRKSANTPTITVFHTPTTSGGTAIASSFLPGGTKNQATGDQGESFAELILDEDTDYLVTITNISGGTIPIGIGAHWYETNNGI